MEHALTQNRRLQYFKHMCSNTMHYPFRGIKLDPLAFLHDRDKILPALQTSNHLWCVAPLRNLSLQMDTISQVNDPAHPALSSH